MTRSIFYGLCGLSVSLLLSLPSPAFAISHGCTNPPDLKDITIDISLDNRKSTASGPFCSAIGQAEKAIAASRLSDEQKKAAYATLANLQNLVQQQGRNAAGKKVSGSVGCNGTVSTGSTGTTATGTCGFSINF
jgi:hypothetical protein